MVDLNATQAAIRAGYSAKTANEQAARLLANVSIKEAIDERLKEAQKRAENLKKLEIANAIKEAIDRGRKLVKTCYRIRNSRGNGLTSKT